MESNRGMPSGSEVESATLHVPVGEELVATHPHHTRGSGMRGRIDDLKSRGLAKVHAVQRSLITKQSQMKESLSTTQSQMQRSMATSPMKWAGIAAGSGFALGMVGRYLHWRNKHHHHAMDIVVIDAMC